MRTYEEQTVPAYTHKVLKQIKCDICGFAAKNENWGVGCYYIDETEISITIKRKEGYSYPECGNSTEFSVDICPNCFKSVLIPFLREKGCEIRKEDIDW